MIRTIAVWCLAVVVLAGVSGCATARKDRDLENQGLRNQLSVLESQIEAKDEEIASLREALSQQESGADAAKAISSAPSQPTGRQIQTALYNAGYNPGSIDGKIGRKTREAIRAFQEANGLKADGKVGAKTWEVLQQYLYKKVK